MENRQPGERRLSDDFSEMELRHFVDVIPQQIFVLGSDGDVLYANNLLLEYYRLTLQDIKPKDVRAALVHPDDLPRLGEEIPRGLSQGVPFEMEGRFRRHDGQYRWFLIRLNPLRDEQGSVIRWYGTRTDIEDGKQAEARLKTLIDTIPAMVATTLPDGSADYVNQRWLEYYGVSLEDLKDWRWKIVVHPEDEPKVMEEWLSALATGKPLATEFRMRRADGKYRWFFVRTVPLRDESGRIVKWYSAGHDIDDRRRAEEEIKELKDQLYKENLALKAEIDRSWMFEEIVGAAPALQLVLTRVSKVATTDSTVLITGETGTGKELIAHAIHKQSRRSSRAFVNVNCAAIPPSLIASELFGHEKGAFTGATQRRVGRFELADGGTIFLDEVGELPLETQVALLRVLQEHKFERVGGVQTIQSDVRVIAASNRNLYLAIAGGLFRSDLFYRLNVFPIEIPPLRERTEDIPALIDYFVKRFAKRLGKKMRRVDDKTLKLLQSYTWPGNIRELQNVIERSIILSETENLLVEENWLTPGSYETASSGQPLPAKLLESEKEIIEAALAEARGRVAGSSGAAAKLQIPPSTLESRIRSLKINKYRFKSI
jgi:formate hydrogenlyase transcriptional activator